MRTLAKITTSLLVLLALASCSFGQSIFFAQNVNAAASGPAVVQAVGPSCQNTSSTTVSQTITATGSGHALVAFGYNEGATAGTTTALVGSAGTATATSTYNPGAGNFIQVSNAVPTGFNGLYQVVTSNSTTFTYANSTTGTASFQGIVSLVPTIAAGSATFVNVEANAAHNGGPRTQMNWVATGIPSGITTVTMTLPASSTGCLVVFEVSGVTATDVVCGSGVSCGTNGNSSPFTGPTITPTASKNEFLAASAFDSSGPNHSANWAATGSWVLGPVPYENGGNFGSFGVLYQIVASTSGSYGITGTNSGSGFSAFITAPVSLKP
jgi:hypothetical protein